jgi:serine/threonine protein kinase
MRAGALALPIQGAMHSSRGKKSARQCYSRDLKQEVFVVMEQKKIIIRPPDTRSMELPGVVSLPDGKKPLKLGSGSITSLISAGGMAIVYEIWNQELEVRRAVKLLKPDHTPESEDRFHTEMKITAKLHHPNIVEIYSVGKWNDQLPYIEMELIDGYTLEKIIADSGSLPPEVCTSIGIMVGRALNYAHNQSYMLYGKRYQGVIHRDLKPGNIMVAKDGIVKLMDFGIAKPMSASIHTIEGVVMGTMQYLAPEQLDGKEVDARADLYSLGGVLYEMLTGTRAFPESNLGKLVTDKLNNNYVQLTAFSAKIPAPLCGLIHRLIRCEKEKRVQTVLEYLRSICAIHKTLTLRAPEQVIEQFMKSGPRQKRLVLLKKKKSVVPAVIWSGVAAALFGAALFLVLFVKPAFLHDILSTVAGMARSQPAVLPADNSGQTGVAIARRVDSILSQQAAVKKAPEPKPAGVETIDDNVAFVDVPPRRTVKSKPEKPRPQPVRPAEAAPPLPVSAKTEVMPGQVARPGEPPQSMSLLDRLRQQFRTSDVMTMFSLEVEAGHFPEALQLYSMLPGDQANSKKAKIYRLRALKGAGDAEGTRSFLMQNDIYDGEFYLEKARSYFNARDYPKAEEFIKRASISPSQFLDQRQYRELLLYSRGLCASALYDLAPGAAGTKKAAMEAWFEVKSLFRNSPDHRYFQKADSEIRRINASVAAK